MQCEADDIAELLHEWRMFLTKYPETYPYLKDIIAMWEKKHIKTLRKIWIQQHKELKELKESRAREN